MNTRYNTLEKRLKQRTCVKNHYTNNKQYYIDKAHKLKLKIRKMYFEYLQTLKCEICGENDWRCLEFDHLPEFSKRTEVSKLIGNCSWNKLVEEIAKCRVLCANCHRKHTAEQQGWYKDLL